MIAQDDGNVVIYNSNHRAVWATNTVVPAEPAAPNQTAMLRPGQGLMPGGTIRSPDGRFSFTQQRDGNLVLYGPGGEAMCPEYRQPQQRLGCHYADRWQPGDL